MTAREKFLINNIGFHKEDLSLIRQVELENIMEELGVSKEWVCLALSKDKLEGWEKWGFALFRKPEFRRDIDGLLGILSKLDEDKFKKEVKKSKGKEAFITVEEKTFRRCYEGVMKQGRLYTDLEAERLGLSDYWAYNNKSEEARAWLNTLIAEKSAWSEIDEEDWAPFVVNVIHVKVKDFIVEKELLSATTATTAFSFDTEEK